MNQSSIHYSEPLSHHQAGALFSILARTQDSDFLDIFNQITAYAINETDRDSYLYGLPLCSLFLFDPPEPSAAYLNLKEALNDVVGLEEVEHPEEYQGIKEVALWMKTGFDNHGALAFQSLLFEAYPEFLRRTCAAYPNLDDAGKKEVLDFILYAADSPLYAELVKAYGHDTVRSDFERLITGSTQDIYLLLMENLHLYENICKEDYPDETGMYVGIKNLFSLDYVQKTFLDGLNDTQAAVFSGILKNVRILTGE